MDDSDGVSSESDNSDETESSGSWPEITHGNKRQKSDRISDLPDSVIQHILSFLPSTKQAIQTGILSKRWQDQWTRVPVLIFDSTGKSDRNFSRFIDQTLMLHDCPNIKKFQIRYDHLLGSDPEIIPKIRFAAKKNVEELTLHLYAKRNDDANFVHDNPYTLPKFLFHSASLIRLDLVQCFFHNHSVNWPRLRELRLDCSVWCRLAFGKILSGCPLLELLELTNWDWYHYQEAVIASESLKKLSLLDFKTNYIEVPLRISCPKLEELSIKVFRSSEPPSTIFPDGTIERVLSGSPFLRKLELPVFSCSGRLVIASKSLKKLVLGRIYQISDLEVSCPCLEELDLYDFMPYISGSKGNSDRKCLAMKILGQLQHVKLIRIGRLLNKSENRVQ